MLVRRRHCCVRWVSSCLGARERENFAALSFCMQAFDEIIRKTMGTQQRELDIDLHFLINSDDLLKKRKNQTEIR